MKSESHLTKACLTFLKTYWQCICQQLLIAVMEIHQEACLLISWKFCFQVNYWQHQTCNWVAWGNYSQIFHFTIEIECLEEDSDLRFFIKNKSISRQNKNKTIPDIKEMFALFFFFFLTQTFTVFDVILFFPIVNSTDRSHVRSYGVWSTLFFVCYGRHLLKSICYSFDTDSRIAFIFLLFILI